MLAWGAKPPALRAGHPARFEVSARFGLGDPWRNGKDPKHGTDQSGVTTKRDVTIHHADCGETTMAGRTQSLNGSILMKDTDATISLVAAFQ
jgi:hypothetical protein